MQWSEKSLDHAWQFHRDWKHQAHRVMDRFIQGRHQFAVQQKGPLTQGETVALWASCDVLVLKVLTRIIQTLIDPFLSKNCYYLKGHGGLRGAVRDVVKEYGKSVNCWMESISLESSKCWTC